MNPSLTFVVIGPQSNAHKELLEALSSRGRVRAAPGNSQGAQLSAELLRQRPVAAVVLLGSELERESIFLRELAAECPETMLIAAAQDASPDQILSALRAGAQEFLRLPLNEIEFTGVLSRVAEFAAKKTAASRRKGRVITIFSNKGGCGASFLASNLAVALEAPTAIVDLNLQAGDLGFYFNLEPKFTLTNVIESLPQMDDALLFNLLTPYSQNVSLLASPRDVDAALSVQAAQTRDALELLRNHFDYVVIDLAHFFDEVTLAALDLADEILLVLNPEITTIRSAQRALMVFDRLDYPREKVRVVANRWEKKSLSLDWGQIERFLGKCAVSFIPNDSQAVVNSINLGEPLVKKSPSSPVSLEVKRLAQALAGKSDAESGPATSKAPAPDAGWEATPSLLNVRTWKNRLGSILNHPRATAES